jgi:predicted nucleic acid-binding protein
MEAASRAGCDRVLSQDLNAGQAIDGVAIENPFAA